MLRLNSGKVASALAKQTGKMMWGSICLVSSPKVLDIRTEIAKGFQWSFDLRYAHFSFPFHGIITAVNMSP